MNTDMLMPYMGLNEPEDEFSRLTIEASLMPHMIMVTGPQGSGTRIMCAILEAGGLIPWHDARHGLLQRPAERVVIMHRSRRDSEASRARNFVPEDWIDVDKVLLNCLEFYPEAHWISYDEMCDDTEIVLSRLAKWLEVEPWAPPEPIERRTR